MLLQNNAQTNGDWIAVAMDGGSHRMRLKYIVPATVLGVGMLISSTLSFAKVEYTKKEKKPCQYCHVTAKSKELNDAGKYYKEKGSLEGYQEKK